MIRGHGNHQLAAAKRTRVQERQSARKGRQDHSRGKSPQQSRKRSRSRNDLASPEQPFDERHKRRPGPAKEGTLPPALRDKLEDEDDDEHPIVYWAAKKRWPRTYFQAEGKDMENILARKRSISARSRQSYSATLITISQGELTPREQGSVEYRMPQYTTLLATKGVFMNPCPIGATQTSRDWCKSLLDEEQTYPRDSLFRDDIFNSACGKLRDKNEARVIQDITRLLVPSAETLHTYGATHLEHLIERVNEGWNNIDPIVKARPQPDYAVGFCWRAFTQEQLYRMYPGMGDFRHRSYFMSTCDMYFPFLTCEVKCGAANLEVADRKNAHSAALAVRAVVELFRLVKREQELHREILAFSISHSHEVVRIYGHFAVIEESGTKYYRHLIHHFVFTASDGKDKWTAYRFTKNVYDKWMPKHFDRISSAINMIPANTSFSASQQPSSGPSQDFSAHRIAQSRAGSASGSASIDQETLITPGTSMHKSGPFKIPRKQSGRRGRG